MEDNKSINWQKIFLINGFGFLLGIVWSQFFLASLSWFLFCLLLAIFCLLIPFSGFSVKRQLFFWSFLILFGFSLGVGRSALTTDYRYELDNYLGQKVEWEVSLVDRPDERELQTKLTVKPTEGRAKILLTTERYPEYTVGDHLLITGKLERPGIIANATSSFDYASYLAKDGIFYQIYRPKITKISSLSGGPTYWLNSFQNYLSGVLSSVLPEPQAGLLGGILLGMRKGIGAKLSQDFTTAGVSHILVLSGYNITIVAEALLYVFSYLSRFWGGTLGIFSIVLFGLVAGGGMVVWRSVLMACIALYARLTGRLYNTASAIMAVAVILSLWRPNSLVADFGLQLGFLALLGLVYLSPIIEEKLFARWPKKSLFKEIASTTIGAQMAVLPLIWLKTGQLTLIGFISNLAVLPLVPHIMNIGFWAMLFGAISPILAWPFRVATHFLLSLVIYLVKFFASLPLGTLSVSVSVIFVALMYLFILVVAVKYNFRSKV